MARNTKLLLVSVGALLCSVLWIDPARAQEGTATEPAPVSTPKTEIYFSGYVLGTMPQDKNLSVGGTQLQQTTISGSVGGGVKAGAFPGFARGILGLEGEIFGYGGKISAPRTGIGGSITQVQGNLTVLNLMLNVLARYPGDILQPYVGVGIGLSAANLSDATIQAGTTLLTGESDSAAFAYQFLAGARAYVTKRLFLFGEYKYFAADYKWEAQGGGPSATLDSRMQIISGGVGLSF